MDPNEALMNVLSGGIYSLGSAGINAATGYIDPNTNLYPYSWGQGGYATPYALGAQPATSGIAGMSLGTLLLIAGVVWLVARG